MIAQTFEGISTGLLALLTLGTSTGAITAAKNVGSGLKMIGKGLFNALKNALKTMFTGHMRKAFFNRAKNHLKVFIKEQLKDAIKDFIKEKLTDAAKETAIHLICKNDSINRSIDAPDFQEVGETLGNKVIESFDIFGAKGMSDNSDGGLNCAKSVVEGLSNIDPTGMLTVAAAFMHPSCDVPEERQKEKPIDTQDLTYKRIKELQENNKKMIENHKKLIDSSKELMKEELEDFWLIDHVAQKCPNGIIIYEMSDFRGNKLCYQGYKGEKIYFFWFESFVSDKRGGYFFDQLEYQGKWVPFPAHYAGRDFNKYSIGDSRLNPLRSIRFGDETFVSLYFNNGKIVNFYFDEKLFLDFDAAESKLKKLSLNKI